jgi:hypothetical protein
MRRGRFQKKIVRASSEETPMPDLADALPVLAVALGTGLALVGALATIGWHEARERGREVARRRRQVEVVVQLVEPVTPGGTLVSRR